MTTKVFTSLSFENNTLFYVALALLIAPVWLSTYPPMVDLPQHAAQVAALGEMFSGNPFYESKFQLNWFTPYLFAYLVTYVFSLIFPVTVALKLVISLAAISTPIIAGQFSDKIGGQLNWRWLILPTSYGFFFYYGFFSFAVAIPLGLFFLILTVRFERSPTVINGIIIAGFALFLFFCHVLVLCFSSLLALTWLFVANIRRPVTFILRCLPYTAPLPLIAFWLWQTRAAQKEVYARIEEFAAQVGAPSTEPVVTPVVDVVSSGILNITQQGENIRFVLNIGGQQLKMVLDASHYDLSLKFSMLFEQIAGIEWLIPSLLLGLLLLGYPLLSGARLNRDLKPWALLTVGLSFFMLCPSYIFGTFRVYERFGWFFMPLWTVVWQRSPDKAAREKLWQTIVIIGLFIWLFGNIGRTYIYERDSQDFRQLLSEMKAEKTVLTVIDDGYHAYFKYDVYHAYSMWYQAEKQGVVDFNYAWFFPQIVRYKMESAPSSGFGGNLSSSFDWQTYAPENYDYLLVRAQTDLRNSIFKENRNKLTLGGQHGTWWLYSPKNSSHD